MTAGRQPLLHDAVIALRAPTQAWSRDDGDMTDPIDGLYHGDRRFVGELRLECDGTDHESLGAGVRGADAVVFDALVRGIDDAAADPHLRLERARRVAAGELRETLTLRSVVAAEVQTTVRVRIVPDFRPLQEVKAGIGAAAAWTAEPAAAGVRVVSAGGALTVRAPGARCEVDGTGVELSWEATVAPRGVWSAELALTAADRGLVVGASARPAAWAAPRDDEADPRLQRWLDAALVDLDALRLCLPDHPDDEFLAAGAPWFLTLFGRDSLWAARMMLPLDQGLAASTLRVLARLQGTRDDPETEEEPGKIPHELRAGELSLPGEGVVLPPLYYGTVDATALWVCLLVEAAAAAMADDEVRALLPHLRAALDWIVRSARADGFLSYIDRSGRGLANQGWKDSGDSIQWRDGSLAVGPIALCEVQGYAFEAAVGAASLLYRLGEPGAGELRAWAADLRTRFRERFWVTTVEGTYPAIALDRDGRPVDTLTSNIGHLLGTGLLDADEEQGVSALLAGPSMNSGYGVRTMSTGAAGYWSLGYHNGAVWAHDSAIVAHGMARAGCHDDAASVVSGLLAAAECFDYRMPELYAGDARADRPRPVPYPAACRPQAWSATAAVVCREVGRRA